MRVSDLDEVIQIENECFYTPWSKEQYLYELNENPYSQLWVMCDKEGKIIGYYDLWIIFEHAEIASICIRKDMQGKGYGTKLIQHLQQKAMNKYCETISLEVRVSNQKAINLYTSNDFIIVNTKQGYYKTADGFEDAYFMMKGI